MANILVLHGPNLNLLGSREPAIYGSANLASIDQGLLALAQKNNHHLESFQSNAEHSLIERIHLAAQQQCAYIIINPAAFTHTSVALRDALAASAIPFIEVHLSNVYAREAFRQHSYFSDLATGVISGFGALSYELALTVIIKTLSNNNQP
ncbi:MAG: type II 3-dehydroquinate dehydratase [Gammaproteobacteria bacterium]|nr:type II 3-dehydroquinate dehydratase [Gammaproteobacteria bacterium]